MWGTLRVDSVAPASLLGQATARFVGTVATSLRDGRRLAGPKPVRRRMVSSRDRSACPERSRSRPWRKERSATAEGEICKRPKERSAKAEGAAGLGHGRRVGAAENWRRIGHGARPGQGTRTDRGRRQTGGGAGMDLAGVLAETRQASTAAGEGQGAVRREENLRRLRPAVVRRGE